MAYTNKEQASERANNYRITLHKDGKWYAVDVHDGRRDSFSSQAEAWEQVKKWAHEGEGKSAHVWIHEIWETTSFRSELQEDNNNYYVKAELPGISKEKIDIELVNNQLRIHAEKEEEKETINKKYHFSEISYGSFTRTYNLPRAVNSQGIRADYKEGMLVITVPKSEESKGKKIKIS
ncbi:11517_t:CDS:2 [Ambispora leptoticha]|uniref:11517_t:CDS:1 n=1 Tax=Ambispora leptoticha TaxID=144679 RepID=A0A9N8V7B8_9GLOM|nr:11517_t:CDS:2 [Ambispora leptoticha]